MLPIELITLQYRLDPFALKTQHFLSDTSRAQSGESRLDLQHLDYVKRGEAAANYNSSRDGYVARSGIGFFRIVVEPVNQRILVNEPTIHEFAGTLNWKWAVTPCAMSQDNRA